MEVGLLTFQPRFRVHRRKDTSSLNCPLSLDSCRHGLRSLRAMLREPAYCPFPRSSLIPIPLVPFLAENGTTRPTGCRPPRSPPVDRHPDGADQALATACQPRGLQAGDEGPEVRLERTRCEGPHRQGPSWAINRMYTPSYSGNAG